MLHNHLTQPQWGSTHDHLSLQNIDKDETITEDNAHSSYLVT